MQVAINILALVLVALLGYGAVSSLIALDFSPAAILVYAANIMLVIGILSAMVAKQQLEQQKEDMEGFAKSVVDNIKASMASHNNEVH